MQSQLEEEAQDMFQAKIFYFENASSLDGSRRPEAHLNMSP